jgi:hypothetical protein
MSHFPRYMCGLVWLRLQKIDLQVSVRLISLVGTLTILKEIMPGKHKIDPEAAFQLPVCMYYPKGKNCSENFSVKGAGGHCPDFALDRMLLLYQPNPGDGLRRRRNHQL